MCSSRKGCVALTGALLLLLLLAALLPTAAAAPSESGPSELSLEQLLRQSLPVAPQGRSRQMQGCSCPTPIRQPRRRCRRPRD